MTEPRDRTASPTCSAEQASDAYMGYAPPDELAAFLNELLEAERAGAAVALASRDTVPASAPAATLLADLHVDEAKWCAMLLRQLKRLERPASPRIGGFREKALAIPGLDDRLAFLNRGQGWVVRKLREMLPRVRDDALHGDLVAMLAGHEANIARTNDVLGRAP